MMKRAFSVRSFLGLVLVVTLMAGLMPAYAVNFQTIRPGDQGEDVRQMQRALSFLGYPLNDDGKYGEQTTNAVQLFQARMRLRQDGLAGDRTLTALYSLAPQFKPGQQGSDQPVSPQPAAPQPEAAASYDSATVYTPNQGSLNLRRTASRGQNTFYQIPYGEVVRVLGLSGQWVRVEAQGRVGYVQQDFLRPGSVPVAPVVTAPPLVTPAPQAPETERPSSGTAQVITANRGSLNLRRTASRGQNTFYQIPYGTIVNILGTSGQWTQVETDGRVGFVQSSFLKPAGSVPTAAPIQTQAPAVTPAPTAGSHAARATAFTPNGGSLNLRAQARTGNNIIGTIPHGGDLIVLSSGASWSQVMFEGGMGWVMNSFLRYGAPAAPATPEVTPAPDPSNAPAADFPRVLRAGDKGDDVRLMQEKLKALGYDSPVNGNFDQATRAAFQRFQSLNGLIEDGVLGSRSASVLQSGSAKRADSAGDTGSADPGAVDTSGAIGNGPSGGQVKLLHWYNDIKPKVSTGQRLEVYHPASRINFTLRVYSRGSHADSEPLTLRDTQLMNKAFGPASWNINIVYVRLPDGRWTMASMHNKPHLSGNIKDNGFDGHLCVHFLRDLDEVTRNDPNYGLSNQKAMRKAWERLTGETLEN